MIILDGKLVSNHIRSEIRLRALQFAKMTGRSPGLAVVLVGDDSASQVYVKNKIKACEEVGIRSFHHALPTKSAQGGGHEVKESDLVQLIQSLNKDSEVDGILVQLPLPKGLNSDLIIQEISPQKDADGLTVENMGLLFTGRPRVSPCTPYGVIKILEHYKIPISGRHCVVVGRSRIVGRPMAQLLLHENATVTVAHSKTKNIEEITQLGDIVVFAAGVPKMFHRKHLKKNAVVIDVGIHRTDQGLCGDVDAKDLDGHVSALTPVPGGVGPMTITMLLHNTIALAEKNANLTKE